MAAERNYKQAFSQHLAKNRQQAQWIYHLPENKDIILREFQIQSLNYRKGFALFIEGLVNRETFVEGIFKPLVLWDPQLIKRPDPADAAPNPVLESKEVLAGQTLIQVLSQRVLAGHDQRIIKNWQEGVEGINYGMTLVLVDGCNQGILIETKGWERRGIEKPPNEQVIVGPHEGFNETLKSNTSLIRRCVRNENLITELLKVGKINHTDVAIMYMSDITDPQLVKKVKERINSLNVDYIGVSGVLEQFLEDNPWMLFPQMISTERPDRAASFLMEGKVMILLDGNPSVLAAPANFYALLHSAEDYYLRLPYAFFIRIIRLLAVFAATLLPALYVAMFLYHPETIPTDLLLAVAAAREPVPFATVSEIFFMELVFELVRESGIRVPGVIGNTIGIVGALIMGQAAVEAGIISPVLIIIVALTGLASFAIPNYSFSFGYRMARFAFTGLAAFFGFLGISGGLFMAFTYLSSKECFGVPFMAPIVPRTKTEPDRMLRGPMWSMEYRPAFESPLQSKRQPRISRGWVGKLKNGKKK